MDSSDESLLVIPGALQHDPSFPLVVSFGATASACPILQAETPEADVGLPDGLLRVSSFELCSSSSEFFSAPMRLRRTDPRPGQRRHWVETCAPSVSLRHVGLLVSSL